MEKIKIYSDGGARGNPGPAGIGVVIKYLSNGSTKYEEKEMSGYIGNATNNQAEYKAVIKALEWIDQNIKEEAEIQFFLDSQLVVEQLNQRYKLKNEGLKPLFWQIRDLIMKLGGRVSFQYIPRAENHHADKLVNIAIDKQKLVDLKIDKHMKGEK